MVMNGLKKSFRIFDVTSLRPGEDAQGGLIWDLKLMAVHEKDAVLDVYVLFNFITKRKQVMGDAFFKIASPKRPPRKNSFTTPHKS
jgi:hypothetical protein